MKRFEIAAERLNRFAMTNEEYLSAPPRALLIEFTGLGDLHDMARRPTSEWRKLAQAGVLCAEPYADPWGWANSGVIALADATVACLQKKYPALTSRPIIASGGSMGGHAALIYCLEAAVTPAACCALYPVCDMRYHYDERADLPRTLVSAYMQEDKPFAEMLKLRSPIEQIARMPAIPYLLIQGDSDQSVHRERHAEPFVAQMRAAGKDIRYLLIPGMGHEPLSHFPAVARQRLDFILQIAGDLLAAAPHP